MKHEVARQYNEAKMCRHERNRMKQELAERRKPTRGPRIEREPTKKTVHPLSLIYIFNKQKYGVINKLRFKSKSVIFFG